MSSLSRWCYRNALFLVLLVLLVIAVGSWLLEREGVS